MPLLDSVHEQATQILRNHAEIPMIMCNIYNPIPASVLDISITNFEFAYMKMKWISDAFFQTEPHIRTLAG